MCISNSMLDLIIIVLLIVFAIASWSLFVAYKEYRIDRAYYLKLKKRNNDGNN